MDDKPNVLFLGSPHWCEYLAALLNKYRYLHAHTQNHALRWLARRNKSICLVGLGPPDTYKRRFLHVVAYVLEKLGIVKHRLIYWIGSDVSRLCSGSRVIAGALNIAGSSWLTVEVRSHGYDCQERLFPVELPVSDKLPFPDTKRLQVLCYVPDEHHSLHGSAEIREVAERLADADFTIIGGSGTWWPDRPDNVKFLGWVKSIDQYLADAHVLLRRTSHDSLSAFVREGLVSGRQVVFTYDVPGVIRIPSGDTETLVERVEELSICAREGRFPHNTLGREQRNRLLDISSQLQALARDYG
jgi:glycosyltransferase involved in cell wall biosynthesis